MRMEIKYVKKFEINKIADFMFDADKKIQWDKNIEEMKYTETNPNTKNFGRLYYKNKKQMALDSRDYDEKVFTVWEGNKLYRYSSSNYEKQVLPSSGGNGGNGAKSLKMSEFYKKRANTVRADT